MPHKTNFLKKDMNEINTLKIMSIYCKVQFLSHILRNFCMGLIVLDFMEIMGKDKELPIVMLKKTTKEIHATK